MLNHGDIWKGIDQLAARNGYSPSGLAKRAGLDPTTFNKSKRITREGKLRWPSTESLAKILEATSTNMAEFVSLIDGENNQGPLANARVPVFTFAQIEGGKMLDASGFPAKRQQLGKDVEEIEFPALDEPNCYAIELQTDLALPLYRTGDILVVSPGSGIRRYDRVLLRRRDGGVRLGVLNRRTHQRLTLAFVGDEGPEQALDINDVAWIARVLWVSQ